MINTLFQKYVVNLNEKSEKIDEEDPDDNCKFVGLRVRNDAYEFKFAGREISLQEWLTYDEIQKYPVLIWKVFVDEFSLQYDMAVKYYKMNKNNLTAEQGQYIGITYNGKTVTGDNEEDVDEKLHKMSDYIYGVIIKSGEDLNDHEANRYIQLSNFGVNVQIYSNQKGGRPEKRIEKEDRLTVIMQNLKNSTVVNIRDILIDTGADFTELSALSLKRLNLVDLTNDRRFCTSIRINGNRELRFRNCVNITIDNSTLPIDVVFTRTGNVKNVNLIGRNVFNHFRHTIDPRNNLHEWRSY